MVASRSPVVGWKNAAATSQPLATLTAMKVLEKGGNAVDAAVAASAVLAVTEPCSSGIGGDCFMLYYDAASKTVQGLNASGRAPAGLTLDIAAQAAAGGKELPITHPHTVTVPGAVRGWEDAVQKWGSGQQTFAELLEPAIKLASDGFAVAPKTAASWGNAKVLKKLLTQVGEAKDALLIDGRAPGAGEIFSNPDMAQSLREICDGGADAFYQGRAGEAIVKCLSDLGGVMTKEDLTQHRSTFPDPISVEYEGMTVWEVPPNGQGITALVALNILKKLGLAPEGGRFTWPHFCGPALCLIYASPSRPSGAEGPPFIHAMIEALRLAFADTKYYCCDNEGLFEGSSPVSELLSDSYAAERSGLFDANAASADVQKGCPVKTSNTVSFQVADADGNAVSVVVSNYMDFGTGLVPEGCGFTLQNRGHNFSLEPDHPNCLAPGKRPYHTIIPCITTRMNGKGEHEFACSLTCMGGFMQPQGHVQLLVLLAQGKNPQQAIDCPRFCILDGECNGEILLEDGYDDSVYHALKQLGHRVRVATDRERVWFGRAQIIQGVASGGDGGRRVLWAGSDSRADGCALAV
ncbi:unnamed protein product [Chrysoparadoxa australica]